MMKRELDEIEMELGKERTLKVGDRVKTIDGKVGVIERKSVLFEMFEQREVDLVNGLWWDARQLIPVEPERVKEDAFPQWHPPCGFQGLCHNGWGSKWCAECPWFDKAPSPGLLQRMGMTWGCEDSPVVRLSPGTYHIGNITVVVQG
jgi:hypothetical protein